MVKEIKVDRQSICMADDVTAPNEDMIAVSEKDLLTDVMEKVAAYLPKMTDTAWAVDSGKEVVAYIIMGKQGKPFQYELCQKNQIFLEMGIQALHCSHFQVRGERMEPLEEAKRCMKERFVERLKIDGGSLCIWGEWFGRPQDNFHVVEAVCWMKDEIRIQFREGESLFIYKPAKIRNEKKQLVIEDAENVLWVWYAYGKPHTYENMYVRQYIKNANGRIIRADGKPGKSILCQSMEEKAVLLREDY